jgi:ComF family protein
MGFVSALLDLLFPPRCIFCRSFLRDGKQFICETCRTDLPYAGAGEELHGDFFSVCVAPLRYEGTVRESLLRYKFHGATGYAEGYAELLADCIRTNLAGRYDLISWVPLSRGRLKERGYDQSMLLALSTALALDDVAVSTLRKVREAEKQSTVGSEEKRRANIMGAYQVEDAELVSGRRILLIDDIVTTGATLSECAGTLRDAGAADVVCAAVARAGE